MQHNLTSTSTPRAPQPGEWRWEHDARCVTHRVDPDLFFPHSGHGAAIAEAEGYCKDGCPVRAWCLRAALNDREHEGVRGGFLLGTSKRQRTRLADELVTLWISAAWYWSEAAGEDSVQAVTARKALLKLIGPAERASTHILRAESMAVAA